MDMKKKYKIGRGVSRDADTVAEKEPRQGDLDVVHSPPTAGM